MAYPIQPRSFLAALVLQLAWRSLDGLIGTITYTQLLSSRTAHHPRCNLACCIGGLALWSSNAGLLDQLVNGLHITSFSTTLDTKQSAISLFICKIFLSSPLNCASSIWSTLYVQDNEAYSVLCECRNTSSSSKFQYNSTCSYTIIQQLW